MTRYPYFVIPAKGKKDKVYKPIIGVILNNKQNHKVTKKLIALIDSGADVCFCADFIGAWLGIPLYKITEEVEFTTANGGKFMAKPANVNILVGGKNYECKFYFTDTLPPNIPVILGQSGFFDKFRVTFNIPEGCIDVS